MRVSQVASGYKELLNSRDCETLRAQSVRRQPSAHVRHQLQLRPSRQRRVILANQGFNEAVEIQRERARHPDPRWSPHRLLLSRTTREESIQRDQVFSNMPSASASSPCPTRHPHRYSAYSAARHTSTTPNGRPCTSWRWPCLGGGGRTARPGGGRYPGRR